MLPHLRWVLVMQVVAVLLCFGFIAFTNPFSDARVAVITEYLQSVESASTDQVRLEAVPKLAYIALNRAEATRAARRRACGFAGGIALLLACNTFLLWQGRRVVYEDESVEIHSL